MKAQVIERDGRPEWAVIPWTDFQRLLALAEERADIAAAESAAAALADGEELIPGDVVKRLVAGEPPLKVWREYRGLDRAALGASADVAESLIERWETGRINIVPDALLRLAAALRIDADDLDPSTASQ
jgi:hypothetical protein